MELSLCSLPVGVNDGSRGFEGALLSSWSLLERGLCWQNYERRNT